MKSSITIAVSSVCNNEILTDRLNKIQLRTVWCSINFYFCSKQTMNVFFHCTFAWICVDFSCKTVFVSYHVISAKTRVLKCWCCCLTELSFEKVQRYYIVRHDWFMMTLERRCDLITVLEPYFLPKRLHSTRSYFITFITWDVGRTLEKLVNSSPSARHLQAFLVFSQHPAWVITPVNP